ncbi:MAG: type II toxin-antitoxin system RelE/ParE family toxin [Acidobacteriota bacterium]
MPGAEKLRGPVDGYRLRVGQYRILYVVDDGRRVVIIGRVGHRKDIYR